MAKKGKTMENLYIDGQEYVIRYKNGIHELIEINENNDNIILCAGNYDICKFLFTLLFYKNQENKI
ncbi:MAG TPA: hypothetical protein VIK44_02870 [Acetobacterium sp.]